MLRRTLLFLTAYALAATLGRALLVPEDGISLFWPAAGVAALWGLRVRSRPEAYVVALLVPAALLPVLTLTGFRQPGASFLVLADLAVALGMRAALDLLVRRRPFRTDPDARVWRLRSTSEATVLVGAAACASLASTALVVVAMHVDGQGATLEDAVAHLVRTLAAVILIGGTGLAWTTRRRPEPPVPPLVAAGAVASTGLLAAGIFSLGLHLPLAYALLLPLFWTAISLRPWLAMLHAAATASLTLVLMLLVGGYPFGEATDLLDLLTRFQLFCVISGILALVISTAIDRGRSLTLQLAASEARALAEAGRLATVTATVPDGLAIVTRDGRVEALNDAAPGYLRRDETGALALPADPAREDGSPLPDHLRPCRLALAGQDVRDQPVAVRSEAERRIFEVSAHELPGSEPAALISFRDATERYHAIAEQRRVEAELAHMAEHDAVTGLPNRHAFDAELARRRATRAATGEDTGLLLLDLDNFKNVNDSLGHQAGDALLVSVAEGLRGTVRRGDLVARVGGDEFAVVLPGADLEVTTRVAHDVVRRVAATTATLAGEQRLVTASVGAVSVVAAERAGADPMALADMLMYEAKEEGRNTVATLDLSTGRLPRMGEQLATRRRVEEALEHDRFELHLQPILDIRRGRVHGAEALLRLRDGQTLVHPGEFMPVVERTGLAVRVDTWVAGEALRVLRAVHARDPRFRLSANVAGSTVGNRDYLEALTRALDTTPVPRDRFVLEVTETAAVADMERAQEFAAALRQRGVGLALDDFGAGFGSFRYLKHLDFSYLKIDGDFVRGLDSAHVDQSIVRSIVGVAKELGKVTIAEHVTGDALLAAAGRLGVDHAQGYGVGRPVPVPQFIQTYLPPSRKEHL